MAEENDKKKNSKSRKEINDGIYSKIYANSKKLTPSVPKKRLSPKQMAALHKAIDAQVSEYMGSFLLLGFGLNNDQKIVIYNDRGSELHQAALDGFIKEYFNRQLSPDIIEFDFGDDAEDEEDEDDDEDESWK